MEWYGMCSFVIWLLSLSTIILRFIHVIMSIISFYCWVLFHCVLIHSPIVTWNISPFFYFYFFNLFIYFQFSSVTQSCSTFCDFMNCSTPVLPIHHQRPEFTQTCIHRVSNAIQPSHPRSSPSPPAPNPSQHQSLFQWVNSSHEVAKVLEFQL